MMYLHSCFKKIEMQYGKTIFEYQIFICVWKTSFAISQIQEISLMLILFQVTPVETRLGAFPFPWNLRKIINLLISLTAFYHRQENVGNQQYLGLKCTISWVKDIAMLHSFLFLNKTTFCSCFFILPDSAVREDNWNKKYVFWKSYLNNKLRYFLIFVIHNILL